MKQPMMGTVFLIPISPERYAVAQVGVGGDLGVFDLVSDGHSVGEFAKAPLKFRVDYWRKSPSIGGWINAGRESLHPGLAKFAFYGHHSVGETSYYAVSHEPSEKEISRAEYDRLEPLATWTHEHIVHRFTHDCDFGDSLLI